jgi:hypothetical protein
MPDSFANVTKLNTIGIMTIIILAYSSCRMLLDIAKNVEATQIHCNQT